MPSHSAKRRRLLGAAIACLTLIATSLLTAQISSAAASDYTVSSTPFRDTFTRTVSAGWGAASSGQSYSRSYDGRASVSNGRGVVSLKPAQSQGQTVTSVSLRDVRASVTVALNSLPNAGNGLSANVVLRGSSNKAYEGTLRLSSDGKLVLKIARIDGSTSTALRLDTVVGSGVKAATDYTLDFQATGTNPVTLAARAYPTSGTAPEWQLTYDDSSANRITSAGTVGLLSYLSGSSGALTASYDNLAFASVTASAEPDPGDDDDGPDPTNPDTSSSVGSLGVGTAKYPVPSNAIYVSAHGNSSGSGTAGSPFGSLATALQKAPSGATIVLRGGTYHESVEVPFNKKLIIQNYPGEAVWMDGASKLTIWSQSGSTWSTPWTYNFSHIVSFTSTDQTSWWVNSKYPMAGYPEQVWINGTELTQVGSASAVTASTFYVDSSSKRLIIGTNPSGKTVEASTLQKALIVHGNGSTLRGFGVKRYATSMNQLGAVSLEVPNLTLENIVVTDNATIGIFAWSTNLSINQVSSTHNGGLGMGLSSVDTATVNRSEFSYNNAERFNGAPVSGGVKASKVKNITVQDSLFKANQNSGGLWFDDQSQQIKLNGNTFRDNEDTGLIFEISDTVKVVDNYLINNGAAGLQLFNTSHAEVWNNTIIGNKKWSIRILQDSRRGTAPVTMFSDANNFKNNVVAFANASCPLLVHDLTQTYTGAQLGVSFNNTAYWRASSTAPKDFACWASGKSGLSSYSTIASFQSATGNDKGSKEFTGSAIVNGSFQLTSAAASAASSASTAVSNSTIAAMLGVGTSWKGLGAQSDVLG